MSLHPSYACPCLRCRDMTEAEIGRLQHDNDQLRKAASAEAAEVERLQGLVREAYNAGFGEGMKEVSSSRGGIPWSDSRFKDAAGG